MVDSFRRAAGPKFQTDPLPNCGVACERMFSMNPNLKPCYECGQPISRRAATCPKCNADFIDGALCWLCGERMKGSEAVRWGGMKNLSPVSVDRSTDRCFHRSCYLLIMQPDHLRTFKCQDCGSSLPLDSFLSDSGGRMLGCCPDCGAELAGSLTIARCTFCMLPLFPDLHHVINVHENRNSSHVVHAPCFRFFRKPLNSFFRWEECDSGKVIRSGGQQ
jgi:hypothetical protein